MKTEFEFPSGYKLTVTDKGFYLSDTRTDEIILDASDMNMRWIVEVLISSTNREFYMDTGNHFLGDHKVTFGISHRK